MFRSESKSKPVPPASAASLVEIARGRPRRQPGNRVWSPHPAAPKETARRESLRSKAARFAGARRERPSTARDLSSVRSMNSALQVRSSGTPAPPGAPRTLRLQSAMQEIHPGAAQKFPDIAGFGTMKDCLRRPDLMNDAFVDHGQPIAHGESLRMIVRGVHERFPEVHLQPLERGAHVQPDESVQIGQGFVQQKEIRPSDQGLQPRKSAQALLS